jgi:uncharacterized membrane protein
MLRHGYFGPGPTVFAWLLFAMLIALLVVGTTALVRCWRGLGFGHPLAEPRVPAAPHADPALGELRIRYARGDITWDEFVQRVVNLGRSARSASSPPGRITPWPTPRSCLGRARTNTATRIGSPA